MNNAAQDIAPDRLAELDRQIVLATQSGLPLCVEPFSAIAREVGASTGQVIERMQYMQDTGVIRRVAAVPNHYALGYTVNGMTVWDVDDEAIQEVGRKVGALNFVSHCYRRPRDLPRWRYNLFAMVHARSEEHARRQISRIVDLVGPACRARDVIFSRRILKKTGLRLRQS